ncbi:MAG TPA: winged helix-turn-helix domain-containing protein [Candidatus Baltobacteraceae bacterium]|nr:winged helix-turn-helix domain-containing protein [Candidatus Baltobacteraceae bacterium]
MLPERLTVLPNPIQSSHLRRFDQFELNLRTSEIYKQGKRVKLQDQPCQVLALLTERPGELVTREELQKRLWPNDTFVDFDHGVNIAINKLRDALGDSAEHPRFIETLPRRGYRWLAPIEGVADINSKAQTTASVDATPEASSTPAGSTTEAPQTKLRLRPAITMSGLAFLLVLALLISFDVGKSRTRLLSSAAPPRIQSIAVLPLENLSHEPEQEYFADGITEELITSLSKIGTLHVTSRTSVMQYKRTNKSLPQIARELNVDGIVEGTVQRSGDRVRITSQLIHAPTDHHLWAGTYDRELKDVLALQDEVARAIANEIKATLTPQEQKSLTAIRPVNPDAYEAYLKGRYYWNKRTADGIRKASEYFQQAINKQPNYGPAYSGLADCNSGLAWHGFASPAEALPKAKAAALKAVEIDPASGEAHASLALVLSHQRSWAAAGNEFKRALELSPGYANAHHWYGDYLSVLGRHGEALAEAKRAFSLDPLSPMINTWLGYRYYDDRHFDEAIEQGRKILDFDPSFAAAHLLLGQAYLQKGLQAQAISELQNATALSGDSPSYMAELGVAYAVSGKKVETLSVINQLRKVARHSYVSSYGFAQIYAALGDKQNSINYLQSAYEEGAVWMQYLQVDPVLDSVRSQPRFQDLVRQMGLQPSPGIH